MPMAIPLIAYAATYAYGASLAATAVAAGLAASSVTIAGMSVATAASVFSMASSLVVSTSYGMYQRRRAKKGNPQTVMARSSTTPRRVIYGRAMVSGTLAFAESEGRDNKYIHMIIPLCEGEIDAVEEIYLNEMPIGFQGTNVAGEYSVVEKFTTTERKIASVQTTSGINNGQWSLNIPGGTEVVSAYVLQSKGYAGSDGQQYTTEIGREVTYSKNGTTVSGTLPAEYWTYGTASTVVVQYEFAGVYQDLIFAKVYTGTATQTAEQALIDKFPAKWTSQHRLQGIAYLYLKMRHDRDVFPSGLPAIKCLVRGKKVLDPRSGVTAWSENWALCVRDYLVNYMKVDSSLIDSTVFNASANHCDDLVKSAGRPSNAQYKLDALIRNASDERRYTMNGVISLTDTPMTVLEGMMDQALGMITWTEGKYQIRSGRYEAPGSNSGIIVTLSEGDLAAPVKIIRNRKRDTLYNAIRGTYTSAENGYINYDITPYRSTTYKAEDNNIELWQDISLPLCRTNSEAQRLLKGHLSLSRRQMVVEVKCNLRKAFALAAGDTCYLSLERHGFSSKVFRVLKWAWDAPSTITMTLREEDSGWSSWTYLDAADTPPPKASTLPDPFTRPVFGSITVTSGPTYARRRDDGTIIQGALVSWPAFTDPFVTNDGSIQVQYRLSNETTWAQAGTINGDETSAFIEPLIPDAQYTFRLRAINSIGVTSLWTFVSATISGPLSATALTGYLTDESFTVAADAAGNVTGGFAGIGGQFKVYSGTQDLTELCTFSVVSSTGVTVTISNTAGSRGQYAVTAMSAVSGKATLRATYGTNIFDKGLSIAKSLAGGDGSSYWITGASAVTRNASNVYTPASVTFSAQKTSGTASSTAYSGRWIISTSTDGTTFVDAVTSSVDEATKSYTPSGSTLKTIRARLYASGSTTLLLDESIVPVVQDGVVGSNGLSAITGSLPNGAHTVNSDATGVVTTENLVGSGTKIIVFEGATALSYALSSPQSGQFTVGTPVVSATPSTPNALTVGAISSLGTGTTEANSGALVFSSSGQSDAMAAADAVALASKPLAYSTSWKNGFGTNPVATLRRNGVLVWQGTITGTLTLSGNSLVIPATMTQSSISTADITTGTWTYTIANAANAGFFITASASATAGTGYVKLSGSLLANTPLSVSAVTINPPAFA